MASGVDDELTIRFHPRFPRNWRREVILKYGYGVCSRSLFPFFYNLAVLSACLADYRFTINSSASYYPHRLLCGVKKENQKKKGENHQPDHRWQAWGLLVWSGLKGKRKEERRNISGEIEINISLPDHKSIIISPFLHGQEIRLPGGWLPSLCSPVIRSPDTFFAPRCFLVLHVPYHYSIQ